MKKSIVLIIFFISVILGILYYNNSKIILKKECYRLHSTEAIAIKRKIELKKHSDEDTIKIRDNLKIFIDKECYKYIPFEPFGDILPNGGFVPKEVFIQKLRLYEYRVKKINN